MDLRIFFEVGSVERPHTMKKMTTATRGLLFLLLAFPAYATGAGFEDFLGRKVTLNADPMRIISLAPNITEMLYFLGLGDRLVGVTTFSDFPLEAKSWPKVGSYTDVNVEKVITLDPDLVIATADGNKRGDVETLKQTGIPVFVINPRTVHQVLDTVEKLGVICGVREIAERKARELRKRVVSVVGAVSKRE